jgi:hypothetical protein
VDYHQYEPYDPTLFARQQAYVNPNLFARQQAYVNPNLFARQQAYVNPNLFARQQAYVNPNLFARQQAYDNPNLFARQQAYDNPNLFARRQSGSAPFEGTQWDPQARAWCAGPVRETERSPDPDPRRNCCSTAGQYCSKHGPGTCRSAALS